MTKQQNSPTRLGVNYLYFLIFFVVLLTLTFSHFLRASQPDWGTHLFFLIYALGQALLEVFCFMLLGYALTRSAPRWTFKIYASLLFVFLLAHFANFTMVRLLDVTLSYFFKFFIGCGLDHFRTAFQAMNMNSVMIGMIIGSIFLVPIAGIAFYWATHKISLKKPLLLSQKQILAAAGCLALLLLLLDLVAKPYFTCDVHDKYKKNLPLGSTYLSPSPRCIALPGPLVKPRKEEEVQRYLATHSFSSSKLPNIYLFVIETLRRDFVNKTIAPHMSSFAEKHLAPNLTFSNSNSTHPSWFSIFHSTFPFQWTYIRDDWEQGSAPLQLLKKMGYKIRAYAAADLNYFHMDQIIFGKEKQLVDSMSDFSQQRIEPCERDARAIQALIQDASSHREGTLFLVFLDSTHSEYSSPAGMQPFQPATISVDYLAISQSASDLEGLQNRYRNAIHWVDHLLGHFFSSLEEEGLYEKALIALTGDHGEEFFEEGALFHGTHLNDWQTRVPLFYKFPGALPGPVAEISSHIDLFPSILHFLTGVDSFGEILDGRSIFAKDRNPYTLSVQHNGLYVPYEFAISDGQNRLHARLLNPPFIHSIPGVEIIALDTSEGRTRVLSEEIVRGYFQEALLPLFPQD